MRHVTVRTLGWLGILTSLILSACGGSSTATPAASSSPAKAEAATSGGAITIWTKFNDLNPQNDQDKWLAGMLATLKQDTQIVASNSPQDYSQINSKLNLAVTAGGDIPDVSYVDTQQLGFHINNGTLEDLTSYVTTAPWAKELNPAALKACTAPDGKIYCVPGNLNSRFIYYWKSQWPNGFPEDTNAFLREAARIKQANPKQYAITFKGSEIASAEGIYFSLIHSFGGTYADSKGIANWASPQTAQAVQFVRELFINQYAPDVALATGFDNENPMKDGTAAAMGAGSWTYVYLNPLKSPTGKAFDAQSKSVDEAVKAGELSFAPYLAAPGRAPAMALSASGWAIPKGAKQQELAKRFIDYQMDAARNADYAVSYGGLPVLNQAYNDPRFQTDYWKFVKENQEKYGIPIEPLLNYDRALTKLSETITKLVLDPKLDILPELQAAQDSYNAGQ